MYTVSEDMLKSYVATYLLWVEADSLIEEYEKTCDKLQEQQIGDN